jgi:uncharacterized protein (DUF2384 family)
MQNNFEAKYIKHAKESLSQDLNLAKRHLNNYKEVQRALSRERSQRLRKEASLWHKFTLFFNKYV